MFSIVSGIYSCFTNNIDITFIFIILKSQHRLKYSTIIIFCPKFLFYFSV